MACSRKEGKERSLNPHLKNILDNVAVVFLQRLLVGFDDVHPDEVGVALVPVSVHHTLQEDLDETETSAGGGRACTKQTHMEEREGRERKHTSASLTASAQQL